MTAEEVTTGDETSFSAYEMNLYILKVPMDHTGLTGAKSLQEQFLCSLAVTKALNDMHQIKQWPENPPTEKQVTELLLEKASGAMSGVQHSVESHSTFLKWLSSYKVMLTARTQRSFGG